MPGERELTDAAYSFCRRGMPQWRVENASLSMLRPALIIHGGAGIARTELEPARLAGCIAALHAGWQVLAPGGSALDAVCAAVVALEDDPHFNAGFGSCLT